MSVLPQALLAHALPEAPLPLQPGEVRLAGQTLSAAVAARYADAVAAFRDGDNSFKGSNWLVLDSAHEALAKGSTWRQYARVCLTC